MEIKWFGTATLAFSQDGHSILFDPFFPMNSMLPSPSTQELSACGDIYITHGHFDHLMHVPRLLQAGNAKVYCCKTAAESLVRDGVDISRINVISPGDRLKSGPFDLQVFRGEHIKFDLPLIVKTLFSRRTLANLKSLKMLLREAKRFPEGQVLVFQIDAGGKQVMHMGSLNLAEAEKYPTGADLLTMPFQGRSDLDTYSMQFIDRLKPKAILLHHTCDSFPPVSSPVRTETFLRFVSQKYPGLTVIKPEYQQTISI